MSKRRKKSTPTPTPAPASRDLALRAALEAAILDNPEDRAAPAAYADLLMDQDDPQGEFIQVQLALEDESLSSAQRKKLHQREAELLAAHEAEWVGDWAALVSKEQFQQNDGRGQLPFPGPRPFRFIRGILAEVTIPFLDIACARLFVRSPQTRLVRRLFVGSFSFEEPGEYEPGDEVLKGDDIPSALVFPRWPYFSNLRTFQLGWTSDENYGDRCRWQCHLRGEEANDLVERMPRLEELFLFADGIDTEKLFRLKTLTSLRVLQIYHCHRYPLEILAENPTFGRLTHLLLHPKSLGAWENEGPYIKRDGVRALLRSPRLANLTHLRLRLTDLGDQGCEEIVQSGILKRLKVLDMRHGCIGDAGARTLAACPDLRNLELLDLTDNHLTNSGVEAFHTAGIRVLADHQHDPMASDLGSAMEQGVHHYLYQGDYE